jgi:O-antigen ligase
VGWIFPRYRNDFEAAARGRTFCLLLGGSTQGVWANATLQISAILILAWALLDPHHVRAPREARQLFALTLAALAFCALQLVPLPPIIWTNLPGRQIVTEGRQLLGLPLGWSSISLAPYDTIATLPAVLPPLAMLAAIVRLQSASSTWLTVALIGTTFLGILVGLLQVTSAEPTSSPWYFYQYSSFGFATGFFANSNHMATLLLVAIPFTIALGAAAVRSTADMRKRYTIIALTAGGLGVILLGLVLNRSFAGFGIGIPVTIVSLLILVRIGRTAKLGAIMFALAAMVAFVILMFSPMGDRLIANGASASVSTRQDILAHSLQALKEYNVIGSGLGTFQRVYRMFEDPGMVGGELINHAHNDYLEIAMEMGLLGLVLVILFLAWWLNAVRRMLASPSADEFAKAGAIGSSAILLHGVVDYPLRTSAIAAIFAMCLALIIVSRRSARSERDLRPTRHVVID